MKTIKQGSIEPKPNRSWWVGLQITCPKCGAVLKLEPGDSPDMAARSLDGPVFFKCPTERCGTLIEVRK